MEIAVHRPLFLDQVPKKIVINDAGVLLGTVEPYLIDFGKIQSTLLVLTPGSGHAGQ